MKKDLILFAIAAVMYAGLIGYIGYHYVEENKTITAEKAELQRQLAGLNGIYAQKNEFCGVNKNEGP